MTTWQWSDQVALRLAQSVGDEVGETAAASKAPQCAASRVDEFAGGSGHTGRMGRLLVVNSGSSSLKYSDFEVHDHRVEAKVGRSSGFVERIGDQGSHFHHVARDGSATDTDVDVRDQEAALRLMNEALGHQRAEADPLLAVGHRVVHGADSYTAAVLVDASVEAEIERLAPLAPLHNPANLAGIRLAQQVYPRTPQVAVFDTAYHSTLPPHAFTYAIPTELADAHRVRRWGFQGSSCAYVTRVAAEHLRKPVDQIKLIVCHLGSGASITAVSNGRSIDTSMGMTPLEGLVMGTRSGDIDASVVPLLMAAEAMSGPDVLDMLTRRSGLLGLCGESDMRVVRRRTHSGDKRAALALAAYTHRVRKYIGAFLTELPQLDAIVFTAGVGEHDAELRRDVLAPLSHLGIRLDEQRNASAAPGHELTVIDDDSGGPSLLVVPTDEELEIALQTAALLRSGGSAHH